MMKTKENNRIEPSEVLRAVIVALNQEPKVSNNWNNFSTCLFCGESSKGNTKFGLSINNNSFYINCFSCGFNTEKKEDYQRVYDSLGIFQDNNYSKYDKEIIKEATAPAPKISLEKISEILTELNNTLVQSKDHQNKFYNKRGYIMPSDYKSLSGFIDIKYLYDKYDNVALDLIFKNKKNDFRHLRDKIIIFHRDDFTGKIVYYRLYSFANQKKYKKLSPKTIEGLKWSIPFRLELITPETTRLIINEGEEKADIGNLYKELCQTFISIPGINNYSSLWKVIEKINSNETNIKEITVLLDKSNKNDLNEEKASIRILSHLESLLNESITLNICELPDPENNAKNDLDGYLKDIPENQRKEVLKKILNPSECYSLKEYRQKYNQVKEDNRERIKHKWEHIKVKDKNINYTDIETARKEYKQGLTEFINSDSNKTYVAIVPPSFGKTTIATEVIKNSDKPFVVALPTKKQRNDYAMKNNFQILEGFTDRLEQLLNSTTKFNDKEKQEHKEKLTLMINHGLNKVVYSYLAQNDMKLKNQKIDKNKTVVVTQDYLICHDDLMNNYEGLYIDENILSRTRKTIKINHKSILDYKNCCTNTTDDLTQYDNKDLLDLFFILKEFIKNTNRNFERKSLTDKLRLMSKKENICFDRIIKNLLETDIKLNKNIIFKKIKSDYKEIPSFDFMNDLIKALKENRVYFYYSSDFSSYFEIRTTKKINTHNKKVLITDGTAQEILLKKYFDIEKIYKPNIKINNIKFTMIADRRYSASYININEIAIKINEISKNDLTLVIVPKPLINELKKLVNPNVTLINFYGSENKATNDYGNYKKAICLMPKIDFQEMFKIALSIDPSITESDFTYIFTSTGYVQDNKEHSLNVKTFKHEILKAVLSEYRECELIQSFFRVKRNDDAKEFFLMGDVSLKEFNLIPDILITEKLVNPENKIKKKDEFESIKTLFNSSINQLGFYTTRSIKFKDSNKAETIVNNKKQVTSNNIYSNSVNLFINNNKGFESFNLHKDTFDNYVKMLVNNGEFIKLSLPLKDNPKHSIYGLPGYEQESILKAKEYFKDVLLSECMKEDYQNTSKIDDIIKDSINTPNYDLNLDIELKNDSLDNAFKSNEVQKEVFAPAGGIVTNGTFKEQKENTTMSYDDYVNTNLSDLYDYLDKFLNDKALKNELINDNDFTLLEDLLNDSTSKCLTLDCFKYEYLITDIADNLISYNQQIQELIDFNKTNSKVISLKEKYDNYVNTNKSYLDNKVNDLIHKIANKDKLIDNKLIDYLIYITKLPLDKNNIEKSLYYQFLAFNLSENIDKYNLIINKIQVDNDNKGIDKELRDTKLDNSYIDTFIDKEPDNNLTNHSSIFSLVFNDYIKDNELKLINDSILKISNINVQKNLRKYISILIINKIKLTNDYFIRLDKWVLKACDVDELIKRQQLRDFVKLCKNSLEVLIAS